MKPNENDAVDRLFRQVRETEPYLDDAGFVDRVRTEIAARPRLPAAPGRWQLPILLLGALLGSLVCYQTAPVTLWAAEIVQLLNSGLAVAAVALAGIVLALVASLALAGDRV